MNVFTSNIRLEATNEIVCRSIYFSDFKTRLLNIKHWPLNRTCGRCKYSFYLRHQLNFLNGLVVLVNRFVFWSLHQTWLINILLMINDKLLPIITTKKNCIFIVIRWISNELIHSKFVYMRSYIFLSLPLSPPKKGRKSIFESE